MKELYVVALLLFGHLFGYWIGLQDGRFQVAAGYYECELVDECDNEWKCVAVE